MEYSKDVINYFLAPSSKRPTRRRYYKRRVTLPIENERVVDEDKLSVFVLLISKKIQRVYYAIRDKVSSRFAVLLSYMFEKPDLSDVDIRSKFVSIQVNEKSKMVRMFFIKSGKNKAGFIFGDKKRILVYKLAKEEIKNLVNAIYTAVIMGVNYLYINTNTDIRRYGFSKVTEGEGYQFYKMWINLSSIELKNFLDRYF